jgi:SAM-dependent methyltransferase
VHGSEAPSAWVTRWAPLVARGPVLDIACGAGRHARLFLQRKLAVVGVDREAQDLPEGATFVRADLEDGSPWPFAGQRFGGIVVTNYLHRPLLPVIAASLADEGALIYETFMAGNERFGKPSNPDFLLRPGELLQAFASLTLVAFEQGMVERPGKALIQRICAVRGSAEGAKIPA